MGENLNMINGKLTFLSRGLNSAQAAVIKDLKEEQIKGSGETILT